MKPSTTPKNADASIRLLDNGWRVLLYKNQLGTYTAVAKRGDRRFVVDDATPSQSMYRLAEKAIGNIVK